MAKTEVKLPLMGEGVLEATLTKWLVKEGDKVEEDDSLLEVATDKVDSELPAPHDGMVEKILAEEGTLAKVGDVLLILKTEGEDPEPTEEEQEAIDSEVNRVQDSIDELKVDREAMEKAGKELRSRTPSGKFLSPLVRNMASEEGISYKELDSVEGTGMDGRITKKDILSYLNSAGEQAEPEKMTPQQAAAPAQKASQPAAAPSGAEPQAGSQDQVVEMGRVRKLIAEHMVHSKKTSAHVSSFVEVDVTALVQWRNRIKASFREKEGEKITFTPIFIEAAVRALKDFPMVNVSVDGDKIIVKKNINIGMATALEDGNLIVPVIHRADEKSLVGLVRSVNDLANRARASKLKPDEISGGTFTVTNFGTFKNLTGTPVINQPEVAILGVGAIRKVPAVVETPQGDSIAIRHQMILSLSYDHRVVDGALGGMFLKRIADYLEQFDITQYQE